MPVQGASTSTQSILPSRSGDRIGPGARRADLDVAHARAGQALVDRREAARVGVGGVDLAVVVHLRRERQRLAAAAGAEVDDLLARLGAGEERRELRALVLDLDPALEEFRLRLHGRAAPVLAGRDAQAEGRERRLDGAEMRQRIVRLLAAGDLQRVDPQVERRAGGQRLHLGHEIVAEETPRATARSSPGNRPRRGPGRRARSARLEPRPLVAGQRLRGEALAREQSAAIASSVRPRCSTSMPSTTARGVSSPMSQAAEAFRRSAS